MNKGKKITILGTGNVGATIAYTLAIDGMASEILLIDINEKKAQGEAMDILQGTPFCAPVNIHAGGYEEAAHSDVVIVYIVVSNPVDVITYAILKTTNLAENQVFGSGTMLDSARLRSRLAEHVGLSSKNVHAYVFGEHGDTSLIPWSLTTIAGMEMDKYCTHICSRHNHCGKEELKDIEEDVRTAGAKVIALKGATFYAIALSVRRICECVLRDTHSVMTISAIIHNQYGINDVCLSLPFVVGAQGIIRPIVPLLTESEEILLRKSADALKDVISQIKF